MQAQQLEPADEISGEAHQCHPGAVGVEVAEGEPLETGGFESADVVLDMRVGAQVHVGVDGAAGPVGELAQNRNSSDGNRLVCAPGCSGSRRTMKRVPSGQPVRSMRSLSSATVAPGRSSPAWVSAGNHRSSSSAARLIAA
jgi:hypothetical protein